MDKRVHTTEFLDITSNNIARNNTSDELDHTIGNAGEAVDGDDTIGRVVAVVREVVCAVGAIPICRLESTASCAVDDQKDSGEEGEERDCD